MSIATLRALLKSAPGAVWLLSGLITIATALPAGAHPGGTDSSGCHTCRTNCSQWGLSTGEYHCHGSGGGGSSGSGGSGSSEADESNTEALLVVTAAVVSVTLLYLLIKKLHEKESNPLLDLRAVPGLEGECKGHGLAHSILDHLKDYTVIDIDPATEKATVELRFEF